MLYTISKYAKLSSLLDSSLAILDYLMYVTFDIYTQTRVTVCVCARSHWNIIYNWKAGNNVFQ